MKSKFFKENRLYEKRKKGLNMLAQITPDARKNLAGWFKSLKEYPKLDIPLIRKLSDITGESAERIEESARTSFILLKKFAELEENIGFFFEDLRSLDVLDKPEYYDLLLEFFRTIESEAHRIFLLQRMNTTVGAGIPRLTESSMSSTIKPVYRYEFRYGEDNLTDYRPKPIGYVAAAQVAIRCEESIDIFAFQVDGDVLDRFISDLLALQREFKDAELTAKKLGKDISC